MLPVEFEMIWCIFKEYFLNVRVRETARQFLDKATSFLQHVVTSEFERKRSNHGCCHGEYGYAQVMSTVS